ncbi:NAD(P)H:quinone oxidoreductase, type IV [Gilbertella persicaria]|uniref:NAD(P)H:quinone oxidoreductase, type IV n=1 Tax=Gilbertella persicaria TaxID=101096 RepID=UPI00222091EB|nr:NAD(P)H:quinone oxidoreductase, type IV [Gilbertella persicaria]KAI8053653.1 NAD(P)H:quinone oxidoreductase, type IV [Gilbertella persicaria]
MSQPKVYVVIYTVYHHVHKLAVEVQKGLESSGVATKMFQVQETLPESVLKNIHAPPKPDLPIIKPEQLSEADGILFGFPTRFGSMPSQVKGLLDATGGHFAKGTLQGKFAGTFFSTASQHGGQETTALTTIPYFVHQGMTYVPLGYPSALSDKLNSMDEIVGGSAYGAGAIAAGDGSRDVSEKELAIAHYQGKNFGEIIRAYVKGKNAFAVEQK